MFTKLARIIVYSAAKKNIVKPEDIDDFIYGISLFISININILSAVIIGAMMGMVIEIILFIIVFRALGKYVGGSHTETELGCYISSCLLYIIVLVILKCYNNSTSVLTIISFLIMYYLAPVEAPNKLLDEIERAVYRRKSIVRMVVCILVYFILHYIIQNSFVYYLSKVIAVTMMVVATSAIEGKIKLRLIQKNM